MTVRLATIVGWAGGIYGLIRGIMLMTQPLYWQASARTSPGQSPVQTEPEPVLIDPIGAAFGTLIVSLIFLGALALLTIRQREAFTGYAMALFALSLLGLPSFGWLFLPATSLLLIAASLLWLAPTGRENSG